MRKFEAVYLMMEIALRGGIYRSITIKTGEFGRDMGYSQQSISRKMGELESSGFIEKRVLVRGLKIRITKKGIDMLIQELNKFRKIDEKLSSVILEGRVVSGMGEGTYYMTREGYLKQFREIFGENPFPGTLNVQVPPESEEIINFLKANYKYRLAGFSEMNRTFGDVVVHRAKINELPCFVIFPERGHYENVVEIVSSENLRKRFSLKDGDNVTLTVYPLD